MVPMANATSRTGSRRRFLTKAALAALLFFVALELVLQVGALVVSFGLGARSANAAQVGAPQVLCVGDSYTYGIGSSSPETSYPGALKRLLAARGHPHEVVNGGWPGQSSRDVLLRLHNQLRPETRVLCVLIGTNDTWRHPEPLARTDLEVLAGGGDDTHGFEFTWRTGKLLALLTRFAFGSWLRSEEGGAATAAGAQAVGGYHRAEAFAALLRLGYRPRQPVWPAGDADAAPRLREVQQKLWAKDFDGARTLAATAVSEFPSSPKLLAALVNAEVRSGVDPTATLAKLEALHLASATANSAEALMTAYQVVGMADAAMKVARARVAEEPRSFAAWSTLQELLFYSGRYEEFPATADAALELAGASSPESSAAILRRYSRVIAERDPAKAAEFAVLAHLLDGDIEHTRICLRTISVHVRNRQLFADAFARANLAGSTAVREFEPLLHEVYDGVDQSAWQEVLRGHLLLLGDMARRNGTKLVLLNYPFGGPVTDTLKAAAETLGAQWVDVAGRFMTELRSRPREELFVADGHCNDAGYALVAEIVADQVIGALGK